MSSKQTNGNSEVLRHGWGGDRDRRDEVLRYRTEEAEEKLVIGVLGKYDTDEQPRDLSPDDLELLDQFTKTDAQQ